jgi:peptide/nickel transport system substrate-binding protein
LAKGGYPNGFEFEFAYSNASWVGVPYQALALKLQSDLARVGIKANLRPQDQLNMRTDYLGGKFKGAIITYWNPQSVENLNWAEAVVQRVAKRVRWDIPKEVRESTFEIAKLQDPKKAEAEWIKWQEKMVDQANLIVLFQPIYQSWSVTRSPLSTDGGGLGCGARWSQAQGMTLERGSFAKVDVVRATGHQVH